MILEETVNMKSISVIVPVYYGERYIPDMIRQIERCKGCLETGEQIELIFVNDAPKAPLSWEWKSESIDIMIINSDSNAGIHGARLKGLEKSCGEYILFLDQDDKIKPEYFKSQLQMINGNDAVACNACDGKIPVYLDENFFGGTKSIDYVLKAWNPFISPGQVLLRKSAIPETWKKNVIKHNGADDWLLWLCMVAKGWKFTLNDEILYEHTLGEANASKNIMEMLHSEQEVMDVVRKTKQFSEERFGVLLEGFYRRMQNRTRQLCAAKEKLDIFDRWMHLGEKEIYFSDYLIRSGIRSVSIYGCGTLGMYLFHNLKSSIDVKYFIDRNAKILKKELPVYNLQDELPCVDAVIISLIADIDSVEREMNDAGVKNTISFKDWIYNAGLL